MKEQLISVSFSTRSYRVCFFLLDSGRSKKAAGGWPRRFFLFSSSVPKKICLCLPRLEGGRGFRGLRHICSSVHLIRNAAANRNSPFPYPPPPPLQFYFPLDNDSCAPTRIAKKKHHPPSFPFCQRLLGYFTEFHTGWHRWNRVFFLPGFYRVSVDSIGLLRTW